MRTCDKLKVCLEAPPCMQGTLTGEDEEEARVEWGYVWGQGIATEDTVCLYFSVILTSQVDTHIALLTPGHTTHKQQAQSLYIYILYVLKYTGRNQYRQSCSMLLL